MENASLEEVYIDTPNLKYEWMILLSIDESEHAVISQYMH